MALFPLPSRPNGNAYVQLIVSVWRTSWLVDAYSHLRHADCCLAVDSPPPSDPSSNACDHMYCVPSCRPAAARRYNENCRPLKLALELLDLKSTRLNCGSGRVPVAGSM